MNKHIKVINGKKYYYKSIRKGKKVTSEYLGPVERMRKKRVPKSHENEISDSGKEIELDEEKKDDYIG